MNDHLDFYNRFHDTDIIDCHWCNGRVLKCSSTLVCSMCMSKNSVNVAMPAKEFKRIHKIQHELFLKWKETSGNPIDVELWFPIPPPISIYPPMGDEIYR